MVETITKLSNDWFKIYVDRKELKKLCKRSDLAGFNHIVICRCMPDSNFNTSFSNNCVVLLLLLFNIFAASSSVMDFDNGEAILFDGVDDI